MTKNSSLLISLRVAIIATMAACLVQCAGEPPEGAGEGPISSVASALEHCGGVVCTGNSNCQVNVPVCALSTSGTCLTTTPRECAWKLNISTSCPCIEHAVRLCTLSGGGAGVQICTASSSTSTYWAGCIACPSCSP